MGSLKQTMLPLSQRRGKYILLLNPDTVVINGAVDTLIGCVKNHPQSLIWGGRTVFEDGSLNPASAWSRQTVWSLFSQACGLTFVLRRTTLFNPGRNWGLGPQD